MEEPLRNRSTNSRKNAEDLQSRWIYHREREPLGCWYNNSAGAGDVVNRPRRSWTRLRSLWEEASQKLCNLEPHRSLKGVGTATSWCSSRGRVPLLPLNEPCGRL